jgi:hypothetical protein
MPSWRPGNWQLRATYQLRSQATGRHGVRLVAGPRDREKVMVRAEGVEPSRAEAQRIFIPSTAFAARTRHSEAHASGLRSGLSLHRLPKKFSGLRCCPSSLYTFPAGTFPAGLGSGLPCDRFPRIWAVLHRRFPDEHSSFLKSVASACSATPALLAAYICLS